MRVRLAFSCSASVVILLMLAPSAHRQTKGAKKEERKAVAAVGPARLSRDSDDIETLDLFYGAGGVEHAPDSTGRFTFLGEDLNGTNPKFEVEDARGVPWRVKLNSERRVHPERKNEAQAETAASRQLWTAGYFVDEDYYLDNVTVSGLPTLHRGETFVSPGGRVYGVRLERRDARKMGEWSWCDNP
jgi:hypothetical protein